MPHFGQRFGQFVEFDLPVQLVIGLLQRLFTGPQRLMGQSFSRYVTQVKQDVGLVPLAHQRRIHAHHAGVAVLHDQCDICVHHTAAFVERCKYTFALLRVQPMAHFHSRAAQRLFPGIPGQVQPLGIDFDQHAITHPGQRDGFRAVVKDRLEYPFSHPPGSHWHRRLCAGRGRHGLLGLGRHGQKGWPE